MKHISLWALALTVVLPSTRLHAQDQTPCLTHQFTEGICDICHQADEEYLYPDQQGFYQISTPQALHWFAQYVSEDVSRATCNVLVTADLDMTGISFSGLGSEEAPFEGEFDGGGHTITNLTIDRSGENNAGLINVGNAKTWIHDLTLGEGCVITGNDNVGGFVGKVNSDKGEEIIFRHLGFEGTINANSNGGGLLGYTDSGLRVLFQTCYAIGTINGTERKNAIISGWSDYVRLTNCYTKRVGTGFQLGYDIVRGNKFIVNNCFTNGTRQSHDNLAVFTDDEMLDGTLLDKLADSAYKQEKGDNNPKLKK